MDDRERIEALAADGRITREEADRLLGVLDDIDHAEQQLGGVDAEFRGPEVDPLPPAADEQQAPLPREPRAPAVPPTQGAAHPRGGTGPGTEKSSHLPTDIQWLEVDLLAGDVDIEVDGTAGSPSAVTRGSEQIELERTETGYRLSGFGQKGDNFIERLVGGFTRGDTRVTLPSGWGLRLSMKAGDISIKGPLRYLTGHLLAGDLDVDEVHGVDLNVSAGDIDLGLLIRDGNHRLHAVAGDINVRLLRGSDARVSGRVNIGDLSVPKGWTSRSKGIGSTFEHTVGQGRAEISLDLGTGDLDVAADGSADV